MEIESTSDDSLCGTANGPCDFNLDDLNDIQVTCTLWENFFQFNLHKETELTEQELLDLVIKKYVSADTKKQIRIFSNFFEIETRFWTIRKSDRF